VARTVAVVNGAMPLGDPATVDLAGLRIAVVATDGLLDAGAAAQRAVADAADALRSAGVKAEAWALPSPQMGLGLTLHALGIDRLQHLVDVAAGTPLDPRVKQIVKLTTMGPGLRKVMHAVLDRMGQHSLAAGLMALAVDPSPAGRAATVAGVDAYRERFAAALAADGFDAVLLPASPLPAIPHGATKTLATLGSYTMLWNILGYPAGVVPWTAVRADDAVRPKARDIVVKAARKAEEGAAGLPIGVQVVARHGEDHVALALMQALETASVRLGEHPGSPAI
jgi:fatty acid amide hydrolase